jgi:hypothetical protein
MTCAEARIAIDARLDGELGPDEAPALEAHLAGCAACAREVEERRLFSDGVARSFRAALDGIEPGRGEHARAAERMAGALRRRSALPARAAAAAVLVVAAGVVLWALSAGPSSEQLALAEQLRDTRARQAAIGKLQDETAADLAFLRKTLEAEPRQDPPALVMNVAISDIERKLSAAPPPPAPAAANVRRVSISATVNGSIVELVQTGDGRVRVTLPNRTIEAASMSELLRRHPDVCGTYAIEGSEGKVRVGESVAVVDLPARLDLIGRTGSWDEDVQWEAWRDWMKGRWNPAEMERRMKEMQDRYRRAYQSAPVPAVTVDLESVLKDVRGMGKHEAHEAVKRVQEEMKALEKRFQEMHELRGRALGLRVFAEDVKKEK